MATVYKIEIIITSEWLNFTEENMKGFIKETLADSKVEEIQCLTDIEITVDKIA